MAVLANPPRARHPSHYTELVRRSLTSPPHMLMRREKLSSPCNRWNYPNLSLCEIHQLAFPYGQPYGKPIRQGGGQGVATEYAAGQASLVPAGPPRQAVGGIRRSSVVQVEGLTCPG